MAQMNEQPGADPTTQQGANNNNDNDNEKKMAEMQKIIDEKNAQLQEMQKKIEVLTVSKDNANNNDDNHTIEGPDNDDDSKQAPKTDVTLSIRGVPEYDQYPYAMPCDKFYFMASIKAPYFRSEKRAPIDLVAVVDESGSMQGERIKLVKETVQFIIKNLESNDRFGIIGYSSGARTVLPLTKMDQGGKNAAKLSANQLRATGGTALCAGLVAGVNMMRQRNTKNDVASVMILTDGQANQGPTSAAAINSAVITGKVPSTSQYGIYPQRQQRIQRNAMQLPNKPMQQMQLPSLLQQKQGVRASQKIINITPTTKTDKDDDDEKENEKEGTKGKLDKMSKESLPCTINTFGFGAGHNASLLESIAEHGRGMYAFIERADMIADTFAECLGGLVSIIGQDLKIKIDALNEVEITKCLSMGYALQITQPKKIYTVSIQNLQSEENRDLIFELKMPQMGAAKDKYPIVQTAVTYKNVIKDVTETLTNICCVNRIEGKQIGERNIELDLQYNRVLAANAMEEADQLAESGKLDQARKVLTKAQADIKASKSNKNKFSQALVTDMQRIQDNMRSAQQYTSSGSKMMKMNKSSHMMQRSCQSSNYSSQMRYMNRSKGAMKSKFSSK